MIEFFSYIFLWILAASAFSNPSVAQNSEGQGTDYGNLFIDDSSSLVKNNQLALAVGYGVNNPYLEMKSTTLTFAHRFHALVECGIQGDFYEVSKTKHAKTLDEDVRAFGIRAAQNQPLFSGYAVARLKLLHGRMNLLGSGALPFAFKLRFGQGAMWFQDRQPLSSSIWGIDNEFTISPNWGFAIAFDQSIENLWAANENIYRNRGLVSAVFIF